MFKASMNRIAIVRPNNSVAFLAEVVGTKAIAEVKKYAAQNFEGELVEIELGRTANGVTKDWEAHCKQPLNTTRHDITKYRATKRLEDFI